MVNKKVLLSRITQFFKLEKKTFTQNGIFFKLCSKRKTNTLKKKKNWNTPKCKQCLLLVVEFGILIFFLILF